MNKKLVYAMLAAFAVTAFNADAKSFKRGVSGNNFALQEEFDVLIPGVSWFYNWGNTPNSNIADVPGEETIEFIPMCWNANYNADGIREYCKAHPGEVIIGDSGVGAAPNLCAAAIADFFDIEYRLVSYDGSADCVTAAVGGHIDGTFTQLSPAKGQLEAGGLKAIACVANERMSAWPDIPTIKETYPEIDFEFVGWVFVSAYKGTDPAKCEYLEGVLGEASQSEMFQEKLASLSMVNTVMTTEEAQQFCADQIELYKEILTNLNLI